MPLTGTSHRLNLAPVPSSLGAMRFIIALLILMTFCINSAAVARDDMAATRTSFARAVREAAPAVVNIYAAKRVVQRAAPGMDFNDPVFNRLFNGGAMQRVQRSLGSGVIVDASGVLVTNLHVVDGAEAMTVVMHDGREIPAKLVNSDEKLDLAVLRLKIDDEKLPAIRFGDSDTLQVGDVVLAVGNPFGIGQSVSMGVVSAVDRTNAALSQYGQFIQTDVAINPGNSGGALVDSTGALVGINTAIFSKTGANIGISFAIPANLVRAVVRDIVTTGHVNRAWFGGVGQSVNPALANRLGLPRAQGVLISDVIQGSPAAAAGVKVGDVLLAMDGRTVADPAALNERIVSTPNLVGRSVPVTVWREGKERTLTLQFEALPERSRSDQLPIGGTGPLAGAVVERLSPALNIELDLPPNTAGVAIIEAPNTPENRFTLLGMALQPGDIILTINRLPIRTLKDIDKATNDRSREWSIQFQRGGRVYQLEIR